MSDRCRFDRETGEYRTEDGEVCDTPASNHCTARRTCSVHLAWGELTCPRCLGRVRQDIRAITQLGALMLPEAMVSGVNSEAAVLAGPAGDPVYLSWRRINLANATGSVQGDGSDETDPTAVLGTWQAMLSEDYGHDLPDRITLTTAAAYLERNLAKVGNDKHQDFRLMAREIRQCRQHLESVLRNSQAPDRGAPCPTCRGLGTVVRLVREYAHWCTDKDCTQQFHSTTDDFDVWVCPRNREHWWTAAGYAEYLDDRKGA